MINHRDTETQRRQEKRGRKLKSNLLSCLLCVSVSLWLALSATRAAEPTVRDVPVRGLQTNGTTTITVNGDDLGKAPKLLLPFAAKQTLKPGNTDKKAEFEVELKDATPGLHHLRVVTEGGVSLPVVIGVDALPQKPFAAKVETLPVALHGAVTGATVLETTFTGRAGQKIVIEVESQRIGSRLKPVVHLYNAKKLQLEWAWGKPGLNGDARLTATLPADGAYTVTLHDAEYAGQNPGAFRLKIGAFDFAEQVFPPVVTKDTKSVELIGSTSAKIDLPAVRGPALPLDWPKTGAWSGPRPFVEVSSRLEFVEPTTPGKPLELPAGRVGVSGKLSAAGEEDKYRVAVVPNTKVRFEVFAERLGSPIDAALVIRNETGGALAQVEDSPGTLDPVLEYTVPDKVTAVTVGVLDSQGRGGPRGIYRLTVDPVKGEGLGDFRLTTPLLRLSLPAGGRAVVPVFAERRGFARKITLSATGFPAGVKLEGATIPADADGTLVTVTAPAPVPAGLIAWTGRSGIDERLVSFKGHPLERLQPWLATEFAVAPTDAKVADFSIDWKPLPADAKLAPGGKLALPVKLTRTDVASPVRLTLLTSQAPPVVNNQPDPNRAIRIERPTEFGAKVSEGDVPVLIPPELPADAYQIAVLAELLTPDKQRVLASAVTPVRKMFVALPVAVKLDDTRFDALLDAKTGATVEVSGSVERLNGFAGDIAVSLTGLPPGVPVPAPITVKAGETDFAFKLAIPPTTPASETKLKLTATAIDPKQPNVRVKGRDVEAVLNVIAPPK
jgi:hypothetical protein